MNLTTESLKNLFKAHYPACLVWTCRAIASKHGPSTQRIKSAFDSVPILRSSQGRDNEIRVLLFTFSWADDAQCNAVLPPGSLRTTQHIAQETWCDIFLSNTTLPPRTSTWTTVLGKVANAKINRTHMMTPSPTFVWKHTSNDMRCHVCSSGARPVRRAQKNRKLRWSTKKYE